MRRVAFVVPFLFETSVRFLRAALDVPGLSVGLISTDPLERFPEDVRGRVAGHWRVGNCLDADQLVQGAKGLATQLGGLERIVGVLEQAQVPIAEARAALGLPGLSVEAAHRFRDKALMKDTLRAGGIPCARHKLCHTADEARQWFAALGAPVVMKPPAGAGAVNTMRIDTAEQLESALRKLPPSAHDPALLEEFLQGEEFSFDAVCVGGRLVWHNISRYRPTPLEVLENDWIQWCVHLPREIDGPEFGPIREVAPRALDVLGLDTGLGHMEWFRRPDGSVAVSEVGARPPGAQFTTLMSYAHDTDMYAAWSKLVTLESFDPPPRRWSVGAAYLRGQGEGKVADVEGLQQAQAELGELVVETRLPKRGQAPASSYEGEGYVILRHESSDVVAQALARLVQLVRVRLG